MNIFYILKDRQITSTNDIMEWGKFMESNEKLIKQENIEINGKKYFVSTVFLGTDHGFSFQKNDAPILFETMIFPENEEESWEDYQTRCCTLDESLGIITREMLKMQK